ncbi:MAG: 4-hydroxythreonine-4-phosphate dehydrogenase PdxA [Pseudomonadota bacterium]
MVGERPIALSMGDPAGIGPEIAAKLWLQRADLPPFLFVGAASSLPSSVPVQRVTNPKDAVAAFASVLPLLDLPLPGAPTPGRPSAENAPVTVEAIRLGAELAASGQCRALVTNPINKKALYEGAGFGFPGHTEFLADLADVPRSVMMLAGPSLKVVPVTIHIPLKDVPSQLTKVEIVQTVRIANNALKSDFGIDQPRIAIAGLNPHAGEGGAMGVEEIDTISPAIELLRSEGISAIGPLPADTMFHAKARARYDLAVTMYHDQGLTPLKALDFDQGVNVTLGLPFIRTSPDHGTAYDIAGKDLADATSLRAALLLADQMAATRARR